MRTTREVDQHIADLNSQRGNIAATSSEFADGSSERFLLDEQQKSLTRQVDSCLQEKNLLAIVQRETELREFLHKQEAQLKELRQKEDFQRADVAEKDRAAKDLVDRQERERQDFFRQQDREKSEALQKQELERQQVHKAGVLEQERQQKEQSDRQAVQREHVVSEVASDLAFSTVKAADVLLEIKQSVEFELEKAAMEKAHQARLDELNKEEAVKKQELEQRLKAQGRDSEIPAYTKLLEQQYDALRQQLEQELILEKQRVLDAQAREAAERSARAARDGMSF